MEVEIGLKNARTTNSLLELRVFAGNLGGNISLSFDTTELKVLLDELKGQKTNRSKRYKSSDYMYWRNALKIFEILESTTTTKEGTIDLAWSSIGMVDLESVAVHEIGHLLGLDHSSEKEAIMFPTLEDGTRKVELSRDDIEGVQILYGSSPNYNGSSTVYTPSRE
ncbi:hypothetical protein MTR67_021982 [Solanum verrucosum]|uniref:Peptidase metallopeptidase domain-containing protein n=1 Tax=Solanum verrucosum TaxID=315347 RepID=A0AAF0TQ49_SOLVR|nr:hypothetical protein MTR67_021982 [Solanum verrucosum]